MIKSFFSPLFNFLVVCQSSCPLRVIIPREGRNVGRKLPRNRSALYKESARNKVNQPRMRSMLINLCPGARDGTSDSRDSRVEKREIDLLIYDSCDKSGNVELISSKYTWLIIRRNLIQFIVIIVIFIIEKLEIVHRISYYISISSNLSESFFFSFFKLTITLTLFVAKVVHRSNLKWFMNYWCWRKWHQMNLVLRVFYSTDA